MADEAELELMVEAAEARHTAELLGLFERTATPCHCQYWHFSGDKNAWLDRLFNAPELNQEALRQDLQQPGLKGLVALQGTRVVGWLKLCPAERMKKLYEQRLYKGLAIFQGPRDGMLTVGCLLVDEQLRRRGVARALVREAVRVAAANGFRAIEAFPRRSEQAGAAELWTGPPSVFLEAGFQVVSNFAPYPVLRYDVSGILASPAQP